MTADFLDLPDRTTKPRNQGLTIVIDTGLPSGAFIDALNDYHGLVDYVKFGWGTSLVTPELDKKIDCIKKRGIDFFFGGTLFEKALHQNKLESFQSFLKDYDCKYIEISDGTLELTIKEKISLISKFSENFCVFSEVGRKDSRKSLTMHPALWVKAISEELKAGAKKVITESRENGTSGICRENGEIRYGLIEEILNSDISINDLIFEAPNKYLQTYFLERLGYNVNLANISFNDIVGLETLRLGLRSDTFFLFNQDHAKPE